MRKLTSRWVIATLTITTMLFAASTLDASALDEPQKGQQKQRQGKKPDNPGGGGGGGGDGDSFPRIFSVTLSGDGIGDDFTCSNGEACSNQGTIDEDVASRHNNHKKNPGDPYHTRARLYVFNDIDVDSLVLWNVPEQPGGCTTFFDTREAGTYVIDGETVTFTGWMQASISLDLIEGEGKYDRRLPSDGPTWTELLSGRDVKGRISAPGVGREWNLRFDDEWFPDGPSILDTLLPDPDTRQDGFITPFDDPMSNPDGINDRWVLEIGHVLAQSWSGDGAAALCGVDIEWTIKRD